ncbi:MAG: DUF58 domain-containing protein [Oscillospiraceae bacterium]|nr:DUF58 domain-containing protein [Oscillospiraceae bacterium]
MAKFKQIFGGLVNYLAAVGLALVFALFLSGRVGWFLVLAFLCAPVISLAMTLIFSGRIYAEVDCGTAALCKGDECEVTVTVINGCFLPTPPLRIEAAGDTRVICKEKNFFLSVMPFSSESFEIRYRAKICGPCRVGVEKIRLTDHFGLFSFKLSEITEDELKKEISVIPDIAEIRPNDKVIRQVMELSAAADDSEDTTESSAAGFGGFPGYDSREYIPGDPLKRINWKQSAKRGKLLVRLDDETACSSVSVVLDSVFMRDTGIIPALMGNDELSMAMDDEIFPLAEQYAVEHALGAAQVFLRQNYSVTFFLMGAEGWQCYAASDEGELSELRTDLAGYSFSEDADMPRFPAHELAEQKGSVSVYCTPYYDRELHGILAEYTGESGKGALKTAVLSASVLSAELSATAEYGEEKRENSDDRFVNSDNRSKGGGEIDG